jgi:peptide/nickel transport system substrate-binding protein
MVDFEIRRLRGVPLGHRRGVGRAGADFERARGCAYVRSVLAAAIALLVAGCGRQSSDVVEAKAANAPPGASEEGVVAYPTGDYVQQAPGKPGGTLHVSTTIDTANLDPHGVSASYMEWFGRMVFDNLVYLDAGGEPQPWLAKSWTISSDGQTYLFHLRDDVTFSDGARFDAEALRLNLEHMRDPATRSPLAARYIVPYRDGTVVDEFTFEAHLSQPYSPFLNVLAQSWLAILSPKQIRENPRSALTAPIGSGPFVLESYTRQQGLRLVRRPDYHWAPPYLHHDGPAYLDRVDVDIIPEALIRYSGLASGQFDFTLEAPPQNAGAIRADPQLVLDRRIRQGNPFRGLAFNTEKAPFDDERVRRAIALAIDREGIVQVVGFGEYHPKADFLAATTRYYDPSFRHALDYDPATANRLLDEAGWTSRDSDGFRTKGGVRLGAELLSTTIFTPSPVIVALQSDLKKVGFDLRLVLLPQTELTDRRTAGSYQAIAAGVWHTNTPDALYIVYASDEISSPRHVGQNSSRLHDAALDDLLGRARRSNDPVLLRHLYFEAQRRLTELVPSVPLYENYSFVAYRKRVHGVLYDTSHNTPIFTAAWLGDDPR